MSAVLPGTFLLLPIHTVERMLEREISTADAHLSIVDPEQTYSGYSYGELRTTFQRGDIAVVVAPARRTIVTVLYRLEHEWRSADGRPSGKVLTPRERRELDVLALRARRTYVLAV